MEFVDRGLVDRIAHLGAIECGDDTVVPSIDPQRHGLPSDIRNTLPIVQEISQCLPRPSGRGGGPCQTGAVIDSPARADGATPDGGARRGRPGYDRPQILAVAVALFNEQGYDATSVSDLAARLGLTKAALYHHFDSKEQLLELALAEALGGLEEVLRTAAATTGSAADRLSAVLRGAVSVLVDRLAYVTLLLRVRGNSVVERDALARRRAFDQQVTALVRSAQQEGSLRSDLDAAVVTRLLFGMVNSIVEWYRPEGPEGARELAADVLTVAFDGLRTR
ncbi:MAG: TetR family transcriptional regulator [Microbacterium sp.]|nr:TetR family transcriptional regulator [Microbacterium sp.]